MISLVLLKPFVFLVCPHRL